MSRLRRPQGDPFAPSSRRLDSQVEKGGDFQIEEAAKTTKLRDKIEKALKDEKGQQQDQ